MCGGYRMGQHYPTDLTEEEWTLLAPLIPAAKPGGRPRTTDIREVGNAIFYVLRSGCQWRLLPQDFPPVVPEYPVHRKSLILPPEGSTLDGTIGQQRLAFAMESPKPCEELIGMGRRPS